MNNYLANAHQVLYNWGVESIIGSAYPSFGFSGRNSAGLLLFNFGF
jgi:hypothetical protein